MDTTHVTLFYWPKIEQYLNDNVGKTGIIELSDLFDYGNLPPLKIELSQIKPAGLFHPYQYIEHVARNLVVQRLDIRFSTWHEIRRVYETAKRGPRETASQRVFDILLVTSKICSHEYYKYFKVDNRVLSRSQLYDCDFLRPVIRSLTNISDEATPQIAHTMDAKICLALKEFLKRKPVMDALRESLARLELDMTSDWISDSIDLMNIYHVSAIVNEYSGLAARDGIVLVGETDALHCFADGRAKALESQAHFTTVACHETGHFLARQAQDDFNYSCCLSCMSGVIMYDDVLPEKLFEIGRHIELLLFGGIQPNWNCSSKAAAQDLMKNALSKNTYPLIERRPADPKYLMARTIPSLSFARVLIGRELGEIQLPKHRERKLRARSDSAKR